MTFLYMIWIGLIWFFGWLGVKLIRTRNVLGIIIGLIMLLTAIGLTVFLIIVAFLNQS